MLFSFIRLFLTKGNHYLRRKYDEIMDFIKFKIDLHDKSKLSNAYILFSNNLDGSGGAPSVLFEYAKYLHLNGEKVVILAGKGGSLSQEVKKLEISYYRMGTLYKLYIRGIVQLHTKGIMVCTLACYPYVTELLQLSNNNIVWWIHEEDKLLQRYEQYIPRGMNDRLCIFCGSGRIKKSLKLLRPDLHLKTLFYGCEDQLLIHQKYFQSEKKRKDKRDEYVISVIGRLCKRKNQLQLIDAVKGLPTDIKSRVFINFVTASWEGPYKVKIESEILSNKNIRIMGPIPSGELYTIYAESDLIVCPSTDDPLPVVVTDAMMFGSNYVVSSGTGQSSLITHGVDGWVYDVDHTEELTRILLDNIQQAVPDIGIDARKLYLKYFSLERLHISINSAFLNDKR